MSPDEILVAVPTRGAVQWATVARLQEVRDANPGLPPILYQVGHLSVALTRNKIVRQFLDGPWKVLAMVDDDVVPPPHFLEMAGRLEGRYAMIGTPHPMPTDDGFSLVLGVFDGPFGALRAVQPQQGLHRCAAVATGCFVVTRAALEQLGPAPFRVAHDPADAMTSDDFLFAADLSVNGYHVGYWYDGAFCNHHTTVALAELFVGPAAQAAPQPSLPRRDRRAQERMVRA